MNNSMTVSGGRVVLAGNMTVGQLDKLAIELMQHASSDGGLSLDCSHISDCDSSLVALLAACKQLKQQRSESLTLHDVPPRLSVMLEVYGLADSFTA